MRYIPEVSLCRHLECPRLKRQLQATSANFGKNQALLAPFFFILPTPHGLILV